MPIPDPFVAEESSPRFEGTGSQDPPDPEPVWTFRGYRLRPSEFNTAMVHFFRAEVQRANVWRQRLDTTTNWAVVTTGAAIAFAFNDQIHHGVILLNTFLITLFLYTEARRYRYYELFSYRVRLMETDFFAAMLVPPFHPAPDWAESLAENLLHPRFSISMWEAFGRRYRRNYLWIYLVLGLAWLGKSTLFSGAQLVWPDVLDSMAIGSIPGWLVLLAGLVFNGALFVVGVLTQGLHQATGEVLPRYGVDPVPISNQDGPGLPHEDRPAWFRHSRRRQQLLALIITDKAQLISEQILQEMRRGVTALNGTGMYTGKAHSVLLCALTVTEVNQLKTLVKEADPKSFIIVSAAQEVLGRGFAPLQATP